MYGTTHACRQVTCIIAGLFQMENIEMHAVKLVVKHLRRVAIFFENCLYQNIIIQYTMVCLSPTDLIVTTRYV